MDDRSGALINTGQGNYPLVKHPNAPAFTTGRTDPVEGDHIGSAARRWSVSESLKPS